MKLHYNQSNGIFSIRRFDRSTVKSTRKHAKIPLIGSTIELSPSVHILITKGSFIAATQRKRPMLPVVVTKWPRVRLCITRIVEIYKELTDD